jgi:hypothetical protein
MPTQEEQLAYLKRADYPLPEGAPLGKEEAALLRRYGHWLEALALGHLEPATPEQEHFVQVARGEADARTDFERAWVKLTEQRDPSPGLLAQLLEARERAEHLRREKDAEREKVLDRVRADLEAVEARYAGELAEAGKEVEELEAAVRAKVLLTGKSVKHGPIHAVFCRGRVTWDGQGLARFAEKAPAVLEFRRVGAPTVQLRYQRDKE